MVTTQLEHVQTITTKKVVKIVFMFPKQEATWFPHNSECHEERTWPHPCNNTNPESVVLPPGADGFYFKETVILGVIDSQNLQHHFEFNVCDRYISGVRILAGPFWPGSRILTPEEAIREFGHSAKTGNGLTIDEELTIGNSYVRPIKMFFVYKSGMIMPMAEKQ